MPAIINPDKIRTWGRTYSAAFRDGLIGKTRNSFEPLTMRFRMTNGIVELPMVEDILGLRKWTGDRQFQQMKARGYQMVAETFEDSIEIGRKYVEDDNMGLFTRRFTGLGRKTQEWPDKQIFEKLEAGETDKGYDDVAFFSASHPENNSTASNLSGAGNPAWYLFDCSHEEKPMIWGDYIDPEFVANDKPDSECVFLKDVYQYGVRARAGVQFGLWQLAYKSKATLDATNLDAAVTTMMQRKNDKGESLGVMPTHLFVPASLRSKGRDIINVEKLASGADNPNYKSLELVVCHRLSNT